MQRPGRTTSNAWISATLSRPDAQQRLFCFSYAGAGAAAYRGWSTDAHEGLDICAIQLPGRENRLRETPLHSIRELVESIAKAILPLLDRPFAFFGHSLGALLAFETARELRRVGAASPTTLFVSACRAPQLPWPHPPVRHLEDLDLLTEVNRRYGSVPSVILADAELRGLLTPALRADMTLVETYTYIEEMPFAFPIVAFGGDTDPMVSHEALAQWNLQTTDEFQHHTVTGDHLFLQTARQTLLNNIERSLGLGTRDVSPAAR